MLTETITEAFNRGVELAAQLAEHSTVNPASPVGQQNGEEYTKGYNAACFRISAVIRGQKV